MATIEIRKQHTLSKDDARKKAEELADKMKDKLSMEWTWSGDSIVFEAKSGAAKGSKGHVDVSDSEIGVFVDLPFLLRPLKGMVESKIKEKLDTIS
ncbi:MAG: polyhydroxyalkanoic acid system family protein [Polyangiales bacterium]